MAGPSVDIRIGGDASGAKAAFGDVIGALGRTESASKSFGQSLKEVGEAIYFPIAAAKQLKEVVAGAFDAMLGSSVRVANQIDKMSKQFDIGVKSLQRLGYAAKQEHGSLEGVGQALKFIQRNLGEAAQGNKELVEAFQKIGLSANELKNADPEDVFLRMSDAMASGTIPQSEKMALAMKVMGRGATELMPMLRLTREEIQRLGDQGEQLGEVMSQDAINAAEKFDDAMTIISSGMQGVQNAILEALGPSLESFAKWIGEVIPPLVADFRAGMIDLWDTLAGIGDVVGEVLGPALEALYDAFAEAAEGVGIWLGVTDETVAGIDSFSDMLLGAVEVVLKFAQDVSTGFQSVAAVVKHWAIDVGIYLGGFFDALSNAPELVGKLMVAIGKGFLDGFQNLWDIFVASGEAIWAAFKAALTGEDVVDAFMGEFDKAFNEIEMRGKARAQEIADAWNEIDMFSGITKQLEEEKRRYEDELADLGQENEEYRKTVEDMIDAIQKKRDARKEERDRTTELADEEARAKDRLRVMTTLVDEIQKVTKDQIEAIKRDETKSVAERVRLIRELVDQSGAAEEEKRKLYKETADFAISEYARVAADTSVSLSDRIGQLRDVRNAWVQVADGMRVVIQVDKELAALEYQRFKEEKEASFRRIDDIKVSEESGLRMKIAYLQKYQDAYAGHAEHLKEYEKELFDLQMALRDALIQRIVSDFNEEEQSRNRDQQKELADAQETQARRRQQGKDTTNIDQEVARRERALLQQRQRDFIGMIKQRRDMTRDEQMEATEQFLKGQLQQQGISSKSRREIERELANIERMRAEEEFKEAKKGGTTDAKNLVDFMKEQALREAQEKAEKERRDKEARDKQEKDAEDERIRSRQMVNMTQQMRDSLRDILAAILALKLDPDIIVNCACECAGDGDKGGGDGGGGGGKPGSIPTGESGGGNGDGKTVEAPGDPVTAMKDLQNATEAAEKSKESLAEDITESFGPDKPGNATDAMNAGAEAMGAIGDNISAAAQAMGTLGGEGTYANPMAGMEGGNIPGFPGSIPSGMGGAGPQFNAAFQGMANAMGGVEGSLNAMMGAGLQSGGDGGDGPPGRQGAAGGGRGGKGGQGGSPGAGGGGGAGGAGGAGGVGGSATVTTAVGGDSYREQIARALQNEILYWQSQAGTNPQAPRWLAEAQARFNAFVAGASVHDIAQMSSQGGIGAGAGMAGAGRMIGGGPRPGAQRTQTTYGGGIPSAGAPGPSTSGGGRPAGAQQPAGGGRAGVEGGRVPVNVDSDRTTVNTSGSTTISRTQSVEVRMTPRVNVGWTRSVQVAHADYMQVTATGDTEINPTGKTEVNIDGGKEAIEEAFDLKKYQGGLTTTGFVSEIAKKLFGPKAKATEGGGKGEPVKIDEGGLTVPGGTSAGGAALLGRTAEEIAAMGPVRRIGSVTVNVNLNNPTVESDSQAKKAANRIGRVVADYMRSPLQRTI